MSSTSEPKEIVEQVECDALIELWRTEVLDSALANYVAVNTGPDSARFFRDFDVSLPWQRTTELDRMELLVSFHDQLRDYQAWQNGIMFALQRNAHFVLVIVRIQPDTNELGCEVYDSAYQHVEDYHERLFAELGQFVLAQAGKQF